MTFDELVDILSNKKNIPHIDGYMDSYDASRYKEPYKVSFSAMVEKYNELSKTRRGWGFHKWYIEKFTKDSNFTPSMRVISLTDTFGDEGCSYIDVWELEGAYNKFTVLLPHSKNTDYEPIFVNDIESIEEKEIRGSWYLIIKTSQSTVKIHYGKSPRF